jgi:hypothetical protein
MTRSPDAPAARDRGVWTTLAAAVLGFQGASTIVYSAILPRVVTDVGIDLPVLGHAQSAWLVLGGLALVAAVGVGRRRAWGRVLGVVSASLGIAIGVGLAPSPPIAVLAAILPVIVLIVLWRRWPAPP